jgi:hypothetical protein
MKTMQAATEKVQEPKRESQQQDAYRAPRLISLGNAVGLVQNWYTGNRLDSISGNGRTFQ